MRDDRAASVGNSEDEPEETATVYVHREAHNDPGVADGIHVSFGECDVADDLTFELKAPDSERSGVEYIETQVLQEFDENERLDTVLETESDRVWNGNEKVEVGTVTFGTVNYHIRELDLSAGHRTLF